MNYVLVTLIVVGLVAAWLREAWTPRMDLWKVFSDGIGPDVSGRDSAYTKVFYKVVDMQMITATRWFVLGLLTVLLWPSCR